MEEPHNDLEVRSSGNRYETTVVKDHGHIIQGNVYTTHDPFAAEKEEEAKTALYEALDFEGSHARSKQLSLPRIPPVSFDWIWTTPFLQWLQNDEAFFWITGKPGSGKSTLMNHLVKTHRTQQTLNGLGRTFTIIDFFFDFRAGDNTANDLVGLIKTFLTQLSKTFANVEKALSQKDARQLLKSEDCDQLEELLCHSMRSITVRVCAFIDGLDEYKGDHTALTDFLTRVQHRTAMKMCFASRPESVFLARFKKAPHIRMQDHNSTSIRVYIDQAIERGRTTLIDIDSVLDEKMRLEILRRAQGVIIWARLAVDELLRIAADPSSREANLQAVLTQLPEDLEEMYTHNLEKLPSQYKTEAALLLCFISRIGTGSLSIPILHGLWDFFADELEYRGKSQSVLSLNAFQRRLNTLLGSFIDHVETNDLTETKPHGGFGTTLSDSYKVEKKEARLMHETLQVFLRTSPALRSLLPIVFKKQFPNNLALRVYARVIEAATKEAGFGNTTELIDRMHLLRSKEFRFSSRARTDTWKLRVKLVLQAVKGISKLARNLEDRGTSTFNILRPALSSDIMILIDPYDKARDEDWLCKPELSAWCKAKETDISDIVVAIKLGLARYIEDRLKNEKPETTADERLMLLTHAVGVVEIPDTRLFRNQLRLRRAEEMLPDRWHARKSIITILNTGNMEVSFGFLRVCLSKTHLVPGHQTFLADILLSMAPLPYVKHSSREFTCEQDQDIMHYWLKQSNSEALSKACLHHLLKAGMDINAKSNENGTVLHDFVRDYKYGLGSYRGGFSTFLLMIKLGSDPGQKFRGSTPLQLVEDANRRRIAKAVLTVGVKREFCRDSWFRLKEILKFHKKHGRWPDLSPYVSKERKSSMARWKVDASGQLIVDEEDVDEYGLPSSGTTETKRADKSIRKQRKKQEFHANVQLKVDDVPVRPARQSVSFSKPLIKQGQPTAGTRSSKSFDAEKAGITHQPLSTLAERPTKNDDSDLSLDSIGLAI